MANRTKYISRILFVFALIGIGEAQAVSLLSLYDLTKNNAQAAYNNESVRPWLYAAGGAAIAGSAVGISWWRYIQKQAQAQLEARNAFLSEKKAVREEIDVQRMYIKMLHNANNSFETLFNEVQEQNAKLQSERRCLKSKLRSTRKQSEYQCRILREECVQYQELNRILQNTIEDQQREIGNKIIKNNKLRSQVNALEEQSTSALQGAVKGKQQVINKQNAQINTLNNQLRAEKLRTQLRVGQQPHLLGLCISYNGLINTIIVNLKTLKGDLNGLPKLYYRGQAVLDEIDGYVNNLVTSQRPLEEQYKRYAVFNTAQHQQ